MPFQSIILGFGDELCKSYLTDFKFLKTVIRKQPTWAVPGSHFKWLNNFNRHLNKIAITIPASAVITDMKLSPSREIPDNV